jgi:hypothetical protein
MTVRRRKQVVVASPVVAEVPGGDRTMLVGAYKTGLILAWRPDATRGYCVSRVGQADEYVDIAELTSYINKLQRQAASR